MASSNDRQIDIVISAKEMAQAVIDKVSGAVSGLGIKVDGIGNAMSGAGDKMMGAFENPIGSVKSLASAVGDKLTSVLAGLGPIGGAAAAGLGLVVGAAVAVGGAVWALADKAAGAAGEIKDFHEKTGIGVGNIGKWEFAVKSAGGSLGTLTGILGKLEIGAAAGKGGEFAAALKDIGINASAFNKMDNEQKLAAIAKGFQHGTKSGNEMATATALMGKSGADNIPLLKDLTDDLLKSGEKLGNQWTTENVEAGDTFGDSLGMIQTALGNVGTKIGAAVLPAVSDMLSKFANSPAFIDGVTGAANMLAHGLGYAVEIIGHVIQAVMDVYAPFAAWQSFLSSIFSSALKGAIGYISEFIGRFSDFGIVSSVVGALGGVFTALKDKVVGAVTTILGWLEKIPGVGPAIKTAMDSAASTFSTVTSAAKGVGSATDAIGGALLRVGQTSTGTTAALDRQNKAHNQVTAATAEQVKAGKDLEAALDRVKHSTDGVTQEQYDHIVALKAQNVSEADIILTMKVTATQVKAVMDSEKARADQGKANAKLLGDIDKFNFDNNVKFWNEQEKIANAKAAKLVDLVNLEQSTAAQLSLLHLTGTALELAQIKQAEDAEIRSLNKKRDAGETIGQQVEDNIRARYQHERDLATGTSNTIVERMAAQGVYTAAQQEGMVAGFKRDYDQMKAAGGYTYDELRAAEQRWRDASNAMSHQALRGFLGHFDQMLSAGQAFASGVGGHFGEVASKALGVASNVSSMATSFAKGDWIGGATKALGMLGSALGALGNASKKGREDFAASMNLSLDGLYKKLQTMGAEGQRLANQALNVIGKHDEAGNKRWMDEVTKFFSNHEAQLQHEDDVLKTYTANWANLPKAMQAEEISKNMASLSADQAILAAHGFSTTQAILAGADAYNSLIERAGAAGAEIPPDLRAIGLELERNGKLTEDNKAYIAGYGAEASKQLKALNDEYKSLADAIANEAPEDIMGDVETQQRARMAEIENQRAALAAQVQNTADAGNQAVDEVKEAARRAYEEISREWEGGLRIPYSFVPTNNPGIGGNAPPAFATEAFVRSPTLAMIGDVAGGELVLKPSTIHALITDTRDSTLAAAAGARAMDPRAFGAEVRSAVADAMSGFREDMHAALQSVVGGDVYAHLVTTIDGQAIDDRTVRTVRQGFARGQILVPAQNVKLRVPG